MELKELKKSMTAGEPPQMAMIFGAENFLRRTYTETFRSLTCSEMPEFNHLRFSASEADPNEVRDALSTPPFIGGRKLVEITDFFAEKADERFLRLFSDENLPAPGCYLLLSYTDAYSPNKALKLYKIFSKRGAAADCAPPQIPDLINWVRGLFLRAKANVDDGVAPYIVETCGCDMDSLKNEISKLCLYSGSAKITKKTVDTVCIREESYKLYTIGEDLINGRVSEALKTLAVMKSDRVEPLRILAAITRSISQVYTVKTLSGSGRPEKEIARAAEFQPNQLFLISRYSRSKLKRGALKLAVAECCDVELKLKTSSADGYFELERLILKLGAQLNV